MQPFQRPCIPATVDQALAATAPLPIRARILHPRSTFGNGRHAYPLPRSLAHPIAPAARHRRAFARARGLARAQGNASVCRTKTSGNAPSLDRPARKLDFVSGLQKTPGLDPAHHRARFVAAAGKDKLGANKSGTAPKERGEHVPMTSWDRRLDTQPTSAWKRRSSPALWSAMPGHHRFFTRITKNLQAEKPPSLACGIFAGQKWQRRRASASLAECKPGPAAAPPYNSV